jgi:hypothetical protein
MMPGPRSLSLLRLPIVFEENAGQAPAKVRWVSTTRTTVVWFMDDRVVFHFAVADPAAKTRWTSRSITMILPASSRPRARTKLKAAAHLQAAGGSKRFAVASSIEYRDIAPGLHLRFYDDGGRLRYDVDACAGAELSKFRLMFEGGVPEIDPHGRLAVLGAAGGLWQSAPRCFVERRGKRVQMDGGFVLSRPNSVGFKISRTVRAAITIDPEIVFGSYVGVTDENVGVSLDASGTFYDLAYGTGWWFIGTVPEGFTQTIRRYDCSNPESPQLLYNTLIRADSVESIASAGQYLFVAGHGIRDVAMPADAIDATPPSSLKYFIVRLEADGTLLRGTYFHYQLSAIAVDAGDSGNVTISGGYGYASQAGAPYATPLRAPRDNDAIVAKFDSALRTVVYFTSIGSPGAGTSVTHPTYLDARNGSAVVTGYTDADDLATPGAFSAGDPPVPSIGEAHRLWVARLDAAGAMVFTAVLGNGQSFSMPFGIGACQDGTIILGAKLGLPTVGLPASPDAKAIVCRISSDGQQQLAVRQVAWDNRGLLEDNGAVWLYGDTNLGGLATPYAPQTNVAGLRDGFISRLSADLSTVTFFTYLGGSDFDNVGALARCSNALVAAGYTSSPDLIPGQAFPGFAGHDDVFVAVLADRPPSVSITKAIQPTGTLAVNQSFTCGIRVTNQGSVPLSGIVIDDVAPPASDVEMFPASPWQQANGRIFVADVTLVPGAAFDLTLEGIVLSPVCFTNRAVVTLDGVQIASAEAEACAVDPAGTPPDLHLSISDDAAVFASSTTANAVTIIVAITNLSTARRVRNVTLRHAGQAGLRFTRVRPGAVSVLSTTPPASWDETAGDFSSFVRSYEATIGQIGPGETVRAFATSLPLKSGAYICTADVRVEGFPAFALSATHAVEMGPVADLRLVLAITHTPPAFVGDLQHFHVAIQRASGDSGAPAPVFSLHAELLLDHGTRIPLEDGGYSFSYWLRLDTGGHGILIRRIREDAAGDTWLASFVIQQVPEIAKIRLPGDITVHAITARVEGALRTLPPDAVWP